MTDDMVGRLFVRVAGEAFDADQLEWRCEECGRDEYACECEDEFDTQDGDYDEEDKEPEHG